MPNHSVPIDLQRIQHIRKLAIALGLVALFIVTATTRSSWEAATFIHDTIEEVGLLAIMASVAGRVWCTAYIGGKKKSEIVAVGPYSICRNPLYVFSFLGAFGVGAQTGSLVMASIFTLAAIVVFLPVVFREEAWLSAHHGDRYRAYMAKTPRFTCRFSNWVSPRSVEIRSDLLLQTLRDGLLFLLAWPIFGLIQQAQKTGMISWLLQLP